jgi:hypothetical protein
VRELDDFLRDFDRVTNASGNEEEGDHRSEYWKTPAERLVGTPAEQLKRAF